MKNERQQTIKNLRSSYKNWNVLEKTEYSNHAIRFLNQVKLPVNDFINDIKSSVFDFNDAKNILRVVYLEELYNILNTEVVKSGLEVSDLLYQNFLIEDAKNKLPELTNHNAKALFGTNDNSRVNVTRSYLDKQETELQELIKHKKEIFFISHQDMLVATNLMEAITKYKTWHTLFNTQDQAPEKCFKAFMKTKNLLMLYRVPGFPISKRLQDYMLTHKKHLL